MGQPNFDYTAHASVDTFLFKANQREIIEQMVAHLSSDNEHINSYRVVGANKSGKTSLLYYLRDMLKNPASFNIRSDWCVIPVDIPLGNISSYMDFVRSTVTNYFYTAEAIGINCDLDINAYLADNPSPRPSEFVQNTLDTLLRHTDSNLPIRVVLMLDDIHIIEGQIWEDELLSTIADIVRVRFQSEQGQNRISVIVTESNQAESRLSGDAQRFTTMSLLPLSKDEVKDNLRHFFPQVSPEVVSEIFYQSGGLPWLLHFLLELLQENPDTFLNQLDDLATGQIIKRSSGLFKQFKLWFDELNELAPQVIHSLAVRFIRNTAPEGYTRRELENNFPQDKQLVSPLLYKLRDLGLLIKPDENERRYTLPGLFVIWYLRYVGSYLLYQQLQQHQQTQSTVRSSVPFKLFMNWKHRTITADGMYTTMSPFDPAQLSDGIQVLVESLLHPKNGNEIDPESIYKQLRLIFRDKHTRIYQDLQDYLAWQTENTKVLVMQCETSDTVDDIQHMLIDYPIEMLRPERTNRYLGIDIPVYKELTGIAGRTSYRIVQDCFYDVDRVNCLLVAHGGKVSIGDRDFGLLPASYDEVSTIYRTLIKKRRINHRPIGRVFIMVDDETMLPKDIRADAQIYESTPENFTKMISGEYFDEPIHLLHYAGHYHFNASSSGDKQSGIVFPIGSYILKEHELGNLFQNGRAPRMIYFSACESSNNRYKTRSLSLGPALISLTAGTLVFIGLRWQIRDHDAQQLSDTFYKEFVLHGLPEQALLQVRKSLSVSTISWAAPVMLT